MGHNRKTLSMRRFTQHLLGNPLLRQNMTVTLSPGTHYEVPRIMPGTVRFSTKSSKELKKERYLAAKKRVSDFNRQQARALRELISEDEWRSKHAQLVETRAYNAAIARGRG